jgi:hypothetical protein
MALAMGCAILGCYDRLWKSRAFLHYRLCDHRDNDVCGPFVLILYRPS